MFYTPITFIIKIFSVFNEFNEWLLLTQLIIGKFNRNRKMSPLFVGVIAKI